jgi:hypothetical protein
MQRLVLLLTPWPLGQKNVFGKDGTRWRIVYGAPDIAARVQMFHYEGEADVSGMLWVGKPNDSQELSKVSCPADMLVLCVAWSSCVMSSSC